MSARGRPSRAAVYRRLDEAVAELGSRLGGLPSPAEAESIWSDIWQALHSGQWADSELVSIQEVRHIHHLAMTPVWTVAPHPHAGSAEGPGGFRRHDIATFPGGMRPPAWTEADAAMLDWTRAANTLQERGEEPWPERVAFVHNQFERAHPFIDGNGRTGRLVLNLLLGRLGYPPAIIYKRDRDKYLNALRKADAGDPGPLGELIARSVTTNLYRFVMPAVAGPVKLLPLPALATRELTGNALRVAAHRGRLRAVKDDDGTWRSSKNWVSDYQKSRHKRLGPYESGR